MATKPKTPAVEPLSATVRSMLERAIHTLRLVHAKSGIDFAVHSEKYGITEGTIDLTRPALKPKRARVQSKLPYGTLSTYYMPFIKDMQPDDLVQIPIEDFDPVSLQSSVTARAGQLWGKGRVTCILTKDKKTLELWRLPEGLSKADMLPPNENARRGSVHAESEAAVDD